MSMQKFYVAMGEKHPKQWLDLYKYYCAQKVYLYNTEKVTFITSKNGKDVTGARQFKYQFLEPFRYWNSDVAFEEKKMISGTSGVEIQKADGTTHFVEGRGKTAEQILEEVLQRAEGRRISVNIPF
ncbi:hypothetical protein SAMD00019534_018700 [Acytostelium subglobosum LB1]|uniref:hypothetical protein n=1 Tax=Acytostelium subglobosum LB1 TaxID=1410327 RepID=UPI000644DFDE|nr:hypothetical protein SAMD00019534_018700 [Acytostelium subglobosum LB1]GAM18695.1 hypothetical protein SAMD00019534_018700 [Acytostelium subglobosum LB1]|eukprot:XP_012757915.1 hypothetical protein SAMD00019534_018700 [Acytostelium subglobosum LB1]